MAGENILIVEDESVVALNIRTRLEAGQYRVLNTVASAEAAVSQVERTVPDLVLMDIRLRGTADGIAAAQQIRERFDIPIVYLTAYVDPQTLERAKETEPYGYILKPFETVELHTTIELALHKHQVDRRVRDRERWLSTTLHTIGDGIIMTDVDGKVTFFNPAAEALTGWTQAESLHNNVEQVLQLLDERALQPIVNPALQVLQQSPPASLKVNALLQSKTGTRIPIEGSAALLMTPQQEIQGAVLIFQDVLERKRVEQALLERTTELERLNEQLPAATAELQQKIQELEDLKTRILTTTSHEFRTPLTVIALAVELLERVNTQWTVEKRLRYVQRIQKAVRSLTDILDDILTFSQSDRWLRFNPAPVNLRQFCQEIIEETQIIWDNNSDDGLPAHQISLSLPSSLIHVMLDANLLWHILTNLLTNAMKFSPNGGPIELTVGLEAESVVLQISDRGIGIPPEDQTHLFEAFHRGRNVGNIPGLGLGLAIAKRCVDLHQGQIQIISQVGIGTRITATLPLVSSSGSDRPTS